MIKSAVTSTTYRGIVVLVDSILFSAPANPPRRRERAGGASVRRLPTDRRRLSDLAGEDNASAKFVPYARVSRAVHLRATRPNRRRPAPPQRIGQAGIKHFGQMLGSYKKWAIHKCTHATSVGEGAAGSGTFGGVIRPASEVTNPRHVSEMPKSTDKITFDPKPLRSGEGWYTIGTYPGGMEEHIPGFHSETEAEEWLARKCQTWLRATDYAKCILIEGLLHHGCKRKADQKKRR